MPDDAQVFAALWNFNAHKALDCLGITERVPHRADAADPFCDVDELVVVTRLDELFKPSVDKSDLRNAVL